MVHWRAFGAMRARLALGVFALTAASAASAATLIHAGRLVDGISDTVRTNQTVVVDDGKITAIESGFRSPASGDQVIDLKDGTLVRETKPDAKKPTPGSKS